MFQCERRNYNMHFKLANLDCGQERKFEFFVLFYFVLLCFVLFHITFRYALKCLDIYIIYKLISPYCSNTHVALFIAITTILTKFPMLYFISP